MTGNQEEEMEFQSTLLAGSDLIERHPRRAGIDISIHTPLRGVTTNWRT